MRCVMTRAFGALILAALTVVAVTGAAALAGSGGNGGGGLSKHDRELLAQAKADGKQDVVLIIASKGGANRDVVKAIEAQGGSILNKDDSLGYVLAPRRNRQGSGGRRHQRHPGSRSQRDHPARRSAARGQIIPTPQTPPSAARRDRTRTCRSATRVPAQFMAANPTWDGRGVTVGILDTRHRPRSPEPADALPPARAKIVDWVTVHASRPSRRRPDLGRHGEPGTSAAARFTVGTATYTGARRRHVPLRRLQ